MMVRAQTGLAWLEKRVQAADFRDVFSGTVEPEIRSQSLFFQWLPRFIITMPMRIKPTPASLVEVRRSLKKIRDQISVQM
jgi:hypothetical protein